MNNEREKPRYLNSNNRRIQSISEKELRKRARNTSVALLTLVVLTGGPVHKNTSQNEKDDHSKSYHELIANEAGHIITAFRQKLTREQTIVSIRLSETLTSNYPIPWKERGDRTSPPKATTDHQTGSSSSSNTRTNLPSTPEKNSATKHTAVPKDIQTTSNTHEVSNTPTKEPVAIQSKNKSCNIFPTPNENYGNPKCNFSLANLRNFLNNTDPQNAQHWIDLTGCESKNNPNAVNFHAVDPDGAWGLAQMGKGRNGPNDMGYTDWEHQMQNAENYEHTLEKNGLAWRYWACAKSWWETAKK